MSDNLSQQQQLDESSVCISSSSDNLEYVCSVCAKKGGVYGKRCNVPVSCKSCAQWMRRTLDRFTLHNHDSTLENLSECKESKGSQNKNCRREYICDCPGPICNSDCICKCKSSLQCKYSKSEAGKSRNKEECTKMCRLRKALRLGMGAKRAGIEHDDHQNHNENGNESDDNSEQHIGGKRRQLATTSQANDSNVARKCRIFETLHQQSLQQMPTSPWNMLTLDLNKLGLDDPQNVCSSSSSSAASFSTRQQPSLSQNIGIIQAKSGDNVQLFYNADLIKSAMESQIKLLDDINSILRISAGNCDEINKYQILREIIALDVHLFQSVPYRRRCACGGGDGIAFTNGTSYASVPTTMASRISVYHSLCDFLVRVGWIKPIMPEEARNGNFNICSEGRCLEVDGFRHLIETCKLNLYGIGEGKLPTNIDLRKCVDCDSTVFPKNSTHLNSNLLVQVGLATPDELRAYSSCNCTYECADAEQALKSGLPIRARDLLDFFMFSGKFDIFWPSNVAELPQNNWSHPSSHLCITGNITGIRHFHDELNPDQRCFAYCRRRDEKILTKGNAVFYGTKWESFVGLAATSDSIYDRWFFVPKSKAMMRVDIAPQPHHHNFSFDPQVQHGQIIRHSQLSQLQLPQQQQYYYSTTMQQRHALQQEQQLVLQSPAQPTLSHFRYQQQYSQRQTQLAQQVTVVQQQQQQICSVAQSAHTYLPLPPPGHGGTTAFDCTQQHTANLGAQGQQHNYGGVGQSQMWGEHQPQHDTFAQPTGRMPVALPSTFRVPADGVQPHQYIQQGIPVHQQQLLHSVYSHFQARGYQGENLRQSPAMVQEILASSPQQQLQAEENSSSLYVGMHGGGGGSFAHG